MSRCKYCSEGSQVPGPSFPQHHQDWSLLGAQVCLNPEPTGHCLPLDLSDLVMIVAMVLLLPLTRRLVAARSGHVPCRAWGLVRCGCSIDVC